MLVKESGSATLDLDLARRADRKLRKYGESLNGLLTVIVGRRGLPDAIRTTPFALDFTVQGQNFTADVTPDPSGRYCAQVRGHDDCFTEAATIPELRAALVEVVEAVLFDIADWRAE